ncbi:hypothetical protein L614_004900000010 [Ochrobactrum sp. J50]|uniref:hypothetical protein n=1 Tax=Brucella/Ochrobactrum group TaxID=2826938 RepID=UPI00119D77AA|nr:MULTISPECIES: hypothetical protein [Brucella/Ochrobactrum group]TWG97803.1 hypothetical protein L614_004900000010 [Ochrobactrum sp. J50]WPM83066.1 hypothetical protein R5W60_21045 [Brucella pseudintermedia]
MMQMTLNPKPVSALSVPGKPDAAGHRWDHLADAGTLIIFPEGQVALQFATHDDDDSPLHQ